MSKVEIIYGGESYSIVGSDIGAVAHRVIEILETGSPGWIEAFDGHGTKSPYRLLISPGVPVALCEAPSD